MTKGVADKTRPRPPAGPRNLIMLRGSLQIGKNQVPSGVQFVSR